MVYESVSGAEVPALLLIESHILNKNIVASLYAYSLKGEQLNFSNW